MRIAFALILIFYTLPSSGQTIFEKYFTEKVLRFGFMLAGNSQKTVVYPVGMKEEPLFAGSHENLIDPFEYGNFKYEVFDAAENRLVYSRGFCSLYQEWQTTDEARIMERSFYEVATMPFPKNKIRFVLSLRERNGKFVNLFETILDPSDYYIIRENHANAAVTRINGPGNPQKCVDIAFIAEGYKAAEMKEFREDVREMADILLSEAPFSDYRERINIWAVEAVSLESGTDIPGERSILTLF